MPTLQPGSGAKILVTGANGYIAAWVVKVLLEKGYTVRGTVRSEAKGKHLLKEFAKYGDKFEVVVVDDITKEDAFDEAVKGVDAIEHTASPFHFNAGDPDEVIVPAVKGTVGILESAKKYGTSVQRVVVTSSCAAVLEILPEPKTFSEADWNQLSVQEVEKEGKNALNASKYRASKTLAERAAWDFYNKNKSSLSWDLVVLNPPFVFGPVIHEVQEAKALNTSALDWYNTVVLEDHGGKTLESLSTGSCWIDVRDLAEAHAIALEKEAAAGERIIVSAGTFTWQDFIDAANSMTPSPIPSHKLPKGVPGAGKTATHKIMYDTSKEERLFGLKKRTIEEMTRDTLADFEARGW